MRARAVGLACASRASLLPPVRALFPCTGAAGCRERGQGAAPSRRHAVGSPQVPIWSGVSHPTALLAGSLCGTQRQQQQHHHSQGAAAPIRSLTCSSCRHGVAASWSRAGAARQPGCHPVVPCMQRFRQPADRHPERCGGEGCRHGQLAMPASPTDGLEASLLSAVGVISPQRCCRRRSCRCPEPHPGAAPPAAGRHPAVGNERDRGRWCTACRVWVSGRHVYVQQQRGHAPAMQLTGHALAADFMCKHTFPSSLTQGDV